MLQIEISQGRASREEQEFVVAPSAGHRFTVRGLAAQGNIMADSAPSAQILLGKKPFDWMTDSQWQMLLVQD